MTGNIEASCIFLLLGCFGSAVVTDDAPNVFVTNGMYPNIGMDWDSSFQSDYFVDTTFLSETYFQGGGRTKKSEGGPANTECLESYSAVLDWSAIPSFYNQQMQVGYIFNKKGEGNQKNEDAYTVSAPYYYSPSSSNLLGSQLSGHYFGITPFVEYVKFENKGGVAGTKAAYLTTSLTSYYGQWGIGLTRTDIDASGTGGGPDDYLNELSVQYTFINLISRQVGIGNTRTDGDKANIWRR